MTSLYDRDRRVISGLGKLRFFPVGLTGGDGTYLIEEGGRRLLDLSAGWGAASLGYGHPALVTALREAAATQAGATLLSTTNVPAVALAERILELVPGSADRRVWFGHSGSDANETVARAVVAATGRKRIIAFKGAYHGGTQGSMAISGHSIQEGASKSPGLVLVPYPDPFRPFERDPSGATILAHIRQLLAGPCPGEDVAAFFIEPIQADGGMIVPPAGFLAEVAAICADYGILTVCDEVKVGLARTGRLHCFEYEGFNPDFVVFGKGLGGGVPISAVVGPASVMDFAQSFSMQTLHGNPICASAALAVLSEIHHSDLATQAVKSGTLLMSRLREAQAKLPQIGQVRGRGLAIGIELVSDGERSPDADLCRKAVYRAWELGVVFYYVGMSSNVLELTPPLTLSPDEAKLGAALIVQSIEDALAGKVSDAAVSRFSGW